jgi:hypothetical protein
LALADKYQIESLVKKCEDRLIKSLTPTNAVELFLFAYLHKTNKLENAAKKYIVENFNLFKEQKEFSVIMKRNPEALFDIFEFSCEN